MPQRACIVCGKPSPNARCAEHKIQRDGSNRTRLRDLAALIVRDGNHCAHCGGPGPYEIDHTIPLHQGGPDTLPNKRLLCTAHCHRGGHRAP